MSKKRRKLSRERMNNAVKNKDKGGQTRKGFMDWTVFKENGGEIKFYGKKEGINKFNIIPFIVSSKLNPAVKSGEVEIGDPDWLLDVWVHRYLGPDESDVVCLKKNYGKACPACEKNSELNNDGKKEDAKKYYPSRRSLMNVQPIVRGESQPLEIFETSHHSFTKELLSEAKACSEGNDIILFADIEEGSIIKFRMEIEKKGGYETPSYKSFDFLEREEELDDELIDQALQLDKALIVLSYEEIERIMYGQDEDEDTPVKKEKENDDSEDDEKPANKKIENDEEEEKPSKKDKEKDSESNNENTKCPHGYKFGSAEKYPECKKCDVNTWEDCSDSKE